MGGCRGCISCQSTSSLLLQVHPPGGHGCEGVQLSLNEFLHIVFGHYGHHPWPNNKPTANNQQQTPNNSNQRQTTPNNSNTHRLRRRSGGWMLLPYDLNEAASPGFTFTNWIYVPLPWANSPFRYGILSLQIWWLNACVDTKSSELALL